MTEQPGRRVVVSGRRIRRSSSRKHAVAEEIDSQTRLGEVYVRSLVRSQLRLAVLLCGAVGLVLGSLPVLFLLFPGLGTVDFLGLPLPWIVLGVLVYPLLIGAAAVYVRHAEKNERDFSDLIGR